MHEYVCFSSYKFTGFSNLKLGMVDHCGKGVGDVIMLSQLKIKFFLIPISCKKRFLVQTKLVMLLSNMF